MKKSFADILRQVDSSTKKKIASKMPQWSHIGDLEIPSAINFEQCSSTATAMYKASLIQARRVADLTGGLGVDTWAFAQNAEAVLHNEMNPALSLAVRRNFQRLGLDNVLFSTYLISAGNKDEWSARLREFSPDLIYLDPARRSATGSKVFRLEDCSPNLLELLPELLDISGRIMVKLSPMADISLTARTAIEACRRSCGHNALKEVIVSGARGEVKELLFLFDREWDGVYCIAAVEDGNEILRFRPDDESGASPVIAQSISAGATLTVPYPSILKSGAYNLPCSLFGLQKLAPSTHMYISDRPSGAGRNYSILEIIPFCSAGMREAGLKYPCAEVTARNIPVTSEQLKARMKVKPGSAGIHIFGCTAAQGKVLIVARTLSDIQQIP